MHQPPPREQQLARCEALRTKAMHLLTRAAHPNMQAQIRRALYDLDEALAWLDSQQVVQRPLLLGIAESASDFAENRLTLVEQALAEYGPNVMEIG